jgi:hypothetical protein
MKLLRSSKKRRENNRIKLVLKYYTYIFLHLKNNIVYLHVTKIVKH